MRNYLKTPLVIATLVACLCGLLTLVQPLDHIYWNIRFRFGQHEAPQSIVLVKLDPGASNSDADTVRLLKALGEQLPEHIYYDRKISAASSDLQEEFGKLGDRLSVVVRFSNPDTISDREIELPPAAIVPPGRVVVSGWFTNFFGYGVDEVYGATIGGRNYPTLSAAIAGKTGGNRQTFRPDLSVDPQSVRTILQSQILRGSIAQGALAGRVLIITEPRFGPGARVGYFGHGRIDPVFLDIAGVEGLESGLSLSIDWWPLLLLFIVCALAAERIQRAQIRFVAYGLISILVLIGPVIIEKVGVFSNPSATIVAALVYGCAKLWNKWRQRVLETSRSGLPNFVALGAHPIPPQHDVVVAVIGRYEEFLATLPARLHGECARQIARRFVVGCGVSEIYHGEGGLFAWLAPTCPIEHRIEHLEGLRALFAAPLLVGEHMFDTNVHFGLERNFELDALTRVNTALASATEALKHGRTVELFEAKRLANAAWELSLLARIDEGMKNGDIWLAYQPQWDYHESRMSGAEALIRWNDPVRGPIRPDEFILQAEQAGRIDALTYWVLEQAITTAQSFNGHGPAFQVSINLSAQLVDKPSLISSVSEIVRRRGVDCRLLTIEVTETAGVCNRPAAIRNLSQLRAMGFRLSIDDFGTGEASLSYLAELPSDELKIDRRFVSQIVHQERERHIVASTINLAHALGQTVVAEGIEDLSTFELLRQLGCDCGQGYYIG
ncbi:MAG TPA: EAL domain-containing protein, partial [Novosphingobium sp.]